MYTHRTPWLSGTQHGMALHAHTGMACPMLHGMGSQCITARA